MGSKPRGSWTRGCGMDDAYVRYRVRVRVGGWETVLREAPGRRRGLSHRGSDGGYTSWWRVMDMLWQIDC